MVRVVAIHGFRITDGGKRTIDTLSPYIEGKGWEIDVDEADYGFWNLWKIVVWRGKARKEVLARIIEAIKHADIIYGHSNGVNFGIQALNALPSEFRDTKIVVWISGAVNSNTRIPLAVKAQLVLHTPYDVWVRLSSYIPFNRWGRQGAIGYTGVDIRNTNQKDSDIRRHSGWFSPVNVKKTWKYLYNFVKGYLS